MEDADNLTTPPQLPPDLRYSCFDENLSSNSVTTERWESYDPRATQLSVAIILLVYMVIGLPCNLLIILSMLWNKLYRQPAHILLINLALNDLLMCATYIPINIISAFAGEFILGASDVQRCHVCQISIVYVIFAVSNLHILALLSLDRFIYIKAPLRYERYVTVKTTLAAVIFMWTLSIIVSIPPLYGFGEIRFNSVLSTCSLYLLGSSKLTRNVNFELFSIAESLAVPLAIMTVTNTWIVCIIRKQVKKIRATRMSMQEEGRADRCTLSIRQKLSRPNNKRQLRIIKIYVAFILSNLVTWSPVILNTAILLTFIYYPHFSPPRPLFVSNYSFFMSQVVVHPIIQTGMIPEIRKLFTPLLCCRRRQRKMTLSRSESQMRGSDRWGCGCWDNIAAAILPSSGTTFIHKKIPTGVWWSPLCSQHQLWLLEAFLMPYL